MTKTSVRVHHRVVGAHVELRVFVGPPEETHARVGALKLRAEEAGRICAFLDRFGDGRDPFLVAGVVYHDEEADDG